MNRWHCREYRPISIRMPQILYSAKLHRYLTLTAISRPLRPSTQTFQCLLPPLLTASLWWHRLPADGVSKLWGWPREKRWQQRPHLTSPCRRCLWTWHRDSGPCLALYCRNLWHSVNDLTCQVYSYHSSVHLLCSVISVLAHQGRCFVSVSVSGICHKIVMNWNNRWVHF